MPLRDDLLAPVAGENPGGANLRYDPVTDAIKEARREEIDAPQGEWKTAIKTADYAQVIKLASDVLAKRSKDLQIAVWLVDAHVRRESFSALAPGFQFLQALLDGFWDSLYPEIEDGDLEVRAAPLEWLGSKLEQPLALLPITSAGLGWAHYKDSRAIGYEHDANNEERQRIRQQAINDHKPTAEDFDAAVETTPRAFYETVDASLASALESLRSLSDFCDAKFGDAAPSFIKTRTAIENIAQQVRVFLNKKGGPAAQPPAPPVPLTVQEPVPAPTPQPARAPVIAPAPTQVTAALDGASEPADLQDAIRRVAAVSKYLRDKTIYDAAAYLMIRAMRWSELRAKAPGIDPAMLEAPPPELRAELKRNFLAGEWDEVLHNTERAMELPCGRCWLDLQRYTVLALENKGEYFAGVARAVQTALRSLLEELPGLPQQSFTDDSPLANAETLAWIRDGVLAGASLVLRAEPVASAPSVHEPAFEAPSMPIQERPPQIEPEEETAPAEVFEQALAAARANRGAEALEMMSQHLATARSGRERFRRRVQLAHLLMSGGHNQIALPILEELAAEIEQRGLEHWERGDALAYPFELLLRCFDSNGADSPQRNKLYARLCRLDPVRALKWGAS
ncbi:MAG: type VI secretion system protein TssA [Acidobacteriaceae bacterium]|nr:type VI secretion system protein TssA [Acidobacteriaceae bacterium]